MGGMMGGGNTIAPTPIEEIEPVDLSDEQARKDRLNLIRRRRRGRASTLHTGWSGNQASPGLSLIPSDDSENANGKSKLGAKAAELKSSLGY